MNTIIEAAKLEVIAVGEILAEIEENAAQMPDAGIDAYSDPVKLLAKFVSEGFAVGSVSAAPSFTVDSSEFDLETFTQRWVATVRYLDSGYLRVLENLLRASSPDSLQLALRRTDDKKNARHIVDARQFDYPKLAIKPPFAVDYVSPPTDFTPPSRTAQIEFRHHLAKDEANRHCETLNTWTELVMRSGFCPADVDPSEAGAMPSLAYQYDPQTIELGFEEFFVFDEACFVSLIAYFTHAVRSGADVGLMRIR